LSILRVSGLSVNRGLLKTIHSISFSIEAGERVALVGPNGAGKSTLIECLIGLIPRVSGGFETGRIGWVPEGRRVFGDLTVRENLDVGADLLREPGKRKQLLEQVFGVFPDLAARVNQAAGTLSGGQQQMLAIGRAWMRDPELLIVDELSLGLAPLVVKDVFRALDLWVRAEASRAMMIVEQNARMALQHADRGLILESGRIVREGSSTELLSDPDLMKSYFS
jgi:branched-chain amino acid transport system ATP-binding protein